MRLSVPFLIKPWSFTIIGTVVVLRYHIFSVSIYRSLYLLILFYSLTDKLSAGNAITIRRHFVLLESLTIIYD